MSRIIEITEIVVEWFDPEDQWKRKTVIVGTPGYRLAGHHALTRPGHHAEEAARRYGEFILATYKMTVEVEDIEITAGQTYVAKNQGTAITPHPVNVTVVWVDSDNDVVHYRLGTDKEVRHTTLGRFREIVEYDPKS